MTDREVDSITHEGLGPETGAELSADTTRPSGGGPGWLALFGVCALLLAGGVGITTFVADSPDGGQTDDADSQEADDGFEPYAGGGAAPPAETSERAETASDDSAAADDPEPSVGDDDSESESEHPISDGLRAQGERPVNMREGTPSGTDNVLQREPDGEEILEDDDGEPISQQEAQERARRDLEGVEEADEEFQQRLRRRDIELNSRVLRERRDGDGVAPIPGVDLSERVQQRLQERTAEGGGSDDEDADTE